MKPMPRIERAGSGRHQSGQAMVEYVVVCGALAIALFVPIDDFDSPDKSRSAIEIVIDGLKLAYERISFALSVPL